jgi:hypothetical protein
MLREMVKDTLLAVVLAGFVVWLLSLFISAACALLLG